MRYILSYVNYKDGSEVHYNKPFDNIDALNAFVDEWKDVSSYQIIVTHITFAAPHHHGVVIAITGA